MTSSSAVPLHRLCVPEPERVPFAIGTFDSIGPLSRADHPHRHVFHEIVLVTSGSGSHVLDFAGYPLDPPHLGFITPGQVHYWHDVTDLDGWVLLFTEDFLVGHPRDRDAWQALRPWLGLTSEQCLLFSGLMQQMQDELDRREAGFLTVLQALLHIFLVRACRLPGDGLPSGGGDRATLVAQGFTRLLAQPGWSGRGVPEFAAEMGVSASYLTEVVRAVTGRTPGKLIRQAQALEARRLLGSTSLTVGQVARQLGFADPAYFCRFFRRETGRSPGDFRRELGGKHHVYPGESIDVRY
ncbi:helix-turn-helix domain-containing protein [Longispora albida]|uniref:helix-turn-helix domain-containing protein n=1 Tax=Longispora albida TaxID=203523 RepID=UPI00037FCE55|nr:helix-turn-helix domain-containing protein [Longispora albida]